MSGLVRRAAVAILCVAHGLAGAADHAFKFAVISHAVERDRGGPGLEEALAATDDDNLAFVVVSGIKDSAEPCSDRLYQRRFDLLNAAQNGIVVSLAASDWAECRNENGRSAAISRLSRLRELLFADEFSLGASRIPLVRQATNPKFRTYVENARWEIGETMFATINLPGNNNHYVIDAGRNSEFEDRTVANREWLQRIFVHARQKKMKGIVLFSDGNALSPQRKHRRDGYLETRRQLIRLSADFPGQVLLVHGESDKAAPNRIRWQGNLGELDAGAGVATVTVRTAAPYFQLAGSADSARRTTP
ncbi:MAG TPA: hypothetical protein VIM12_00235 [Noviherbaspirillum sp.]|jgi:hypothetical protein|uniref:hypothetical protein n=1 Tax=Noviherbaspirillum sp. TaxID=1926288 RepID=UPI002F95D264